MHDLSVCTLSTVSSTFSVIQKYSSITVLFSQRKQLLYGLKFIYITKRTWLSVLLFICSEKPCKLVTFLYVPVVKRLDGTICQINHYALDKRYQNLLSFDQCVFFIPFHQPRVHHMTFLVDSYSLNGQCYKECKSQSAESVLLIKTC